MLASVVTYGLDCRSATSCAFFAEPPPALNEVKGSTAACALQRRRSRAISFYCNIAIL